MQVYVARHGEAEHNLKDLLNDTTVPDVSLTPRGIVQSNQLARSLRVVPFEAIFVSRLRRTQQTAKHVNEYHKVPIVVNPLLDDIVSGIAGQPFEDFRLLVEGSSDPWNVHFTDGESYNDVVGRAQRFLDWLRPQSYESVLVVTSGGVANNLYGLSQGMTNREMFSRPIENAAVVAFTL